MFYSNRISAAPPAIKLRRIAGRRWMRFGNRLFWLRAPLWLLPMFLSAASDAWELSTEVIKGSELSLFEIESPAMGTRFVIKGYAATRVQFAAAADQAMKRVRALDDCLSDYKADSEASRLTESGSLAYQSTVPISDSLFQVLSFAKSLHTQTNGAVDVTIGPVTRLWRRARRRRELPKSIQLEEAMNRTGMDSVEIYDRRRRALEVASSDGHKSNSSALEACQPALRLKKRGMRFDFGAIGKGFAADEAVRCLRAAGVESCLVDGGGDLAMGAAPPGSTGWRIRCDTGAANASHDLRADASEESSENSNEWLCLSNCGVATSGDSARGFDFANVRYSHIVTPRDGQSLTGRKIVTIVAPTAVEADGLATAASVMDISSAIEVVEAAKYCELSCVWYVSLGEAPGEGWERVSISGSSDVRFRRQTSGFGGLNR